MKDEKGMNRRRFLRAAAATPITATDAKAYDPGAEETKARYRESDHVKTYYRTNRY